MNCEETPVLEHDLSYLLKSHIVLHCIALGILLALPGLSAGEILTIDEDFSTTAHRDNAMTTAFWDTTQLQIHLQEQILSARGDLNTNSAYWSAGSGDYLFLADGLSGLRSINISDPDIPVGADLIACTDQAKSVAIAGDHAFVAAGSSGLQVIDISNPENMLDGGYFTNDGDLAYVSTVAISGDALYLAESGSGVAIFNISDPAQPVFVSHLSTGSWAQDVFVADNNLFVIDGGLKIFDLTNPYVPVEISTTSMVSTALRVTTNGQRAFVAAGNNGLLIFDISDTSTPVEIGSLDIWGSCKQATATASGDTVFVAAGDQGLYILDAADPESIETLDSFDTINSAVHIFYSNDLIQMCASGDGLKIYQIDPNGLDPLANRAQSINLNDTTDPVSRVRLSAAVSDSISFQITADGGSTWHDISPGDDWLEFAESGNDVRWRADLFITDSSPVSGPAIGSISLSMDRLASFAEISAVSDVPGDSGLQVRLSFSASRHDAPDSEFQITEYSIYRRFDGYQQKNLDPDLAYPPGQWDFVTTIPADMENHYAAVVPTLADSNFAGVPWSVFFVRTRTTETGVFFDSPPDSGFSVNNLQPSPPTGLIVDTTPETGTQLTWDVSSEPRFANFRIYRSLQPDTPVQPATLFAVTTGTEFFDETPTLYYYRLTQMTLDGQESNPSSNLTPVAGAGRTLQLRPNAPNPFNPRTEISFFTAGESETVSLDIFDARGNRIRQLLSGPLNGGWHTAVWNGRDDHGRPCASGIYHARLRQGTARQVMKMTLVR